MKKLLLPLLIGFTAVSGQAQIANGGFETWNKVLLFEHPYTGYSDMSSNYETYFNNGLLSVTKVHQDNNTVLRIENVMGSEEVMPGYFIFGKTPTDGLVFGGGTTVFDLNMTGISMDLKYDMRESSEGFIVVQFKDGNTPVGEGNYGTGTHLFPITGTEDWSNREFEFDFPVHPTANKCVIGIASADLINNDMPYALGSFIEVDNIKFIDSQNTVIGGDFEAWQHVDPIMVPDECVVEIHPFSPNYAQSSDVFSGSYAIRLKTILRESGDLSVGKLLMGNKDESGGIIPTIEIDQNEILTFMYSYTATDDLAQAEILFYNEANGFEQVFEHTLQLSPTSDYELVEFPFKEILQEMEITATHMSLEFKSSIETAELPAQLGSRLLIDDVYLETSVGLISIKNIKSSHEVNAYPNPTSGRVIFSFPTPRFGYYRVFNANGRQIAVREFSGSNNIVYDLGPHRPGIYLFKFHHNTGTEYSRVIKY